MLTPKAMFKITRLVREYERLARMGGLSQIRP